MRDKTKENVTLDEAINKAVATANTKAIKSEFLEAGRVQERAAGMAIAKKCVLDKLQELIDEEAYETDRGDMVLSVSDLIRGLGFEPVEFDKK